MKIVFITGVTSGLGEELAKRYLRMGARVYGAGRNQQQLDALSQQFENFCAIKLDVTDKQQCMSKISQIEDNIDVVILSAGNCEYIDLDHFDSNIIARIMDVNVNSIGHCVEALLPKLQAGSTLAVISSSVTYLPIAKAEAYGGSKAAVDYLTRALSLSLQDRGIHTCLIHPGFVDTPLTQRNKFKMPFLMSVEEAGKRIMQGLEAKKPLVAFPKRLVWTLKILNMLPLSISHRLMNG